MWFPSSLQLTEAQTHEISLKAQDVSSSNKSTDIPKTIITEDMDEQAGSQEAVQPGVFLHPDESPPAGHLIASLFYKWRKWSELNTQCSCAAGAINPAVELRAPVQDRCAF